MKKRFNSFYNNFKNDGLEPFDLTYKGMPFKIQLKPKFPIIRIRLLIIFGLFIFLLLFLLSISASLNKKYEYSFTSDEMSLQKTLDLIIIAKSPRLLTRYLKTVIYEDLQDDYGWTPLHWAGFVDKQEIIDILLNHGADPNIKSTKPWGVFPSGISPFELFSKDN